MDDIKLYQVATIGIAEEDGGIASATVSSGTKSKNDKTTADDALEIEISAVLALSSLKQLIRYIKPRQRYHYLCLDSANAIFSPDRSKLQWLINDGIPIYRDGYINLCRPLENIVMMRLGRMSWSSMDTSNMNIIANDRIGVGFDEFVSQCALVPAGPKLHFIQYDKDVSQTGNTLTTTSFFENRGWFRFRKPFAKLDTLTLNLWNLSNMSNIIIPDIYVSLPAIQAFYVIPGPRSPYVYPIKLAAADLYTLPIVYAMRGNATNYLYSLTMQGELLQFNGFTTNDPVADAALIAAYNSIHTITEFSIGARLPWLISPIDISGASLIIGQEVPITITFIYKPRMIAALELITEEL